MGIRCALILSLFLFGVPFGHGQTFVHIPDDLPAVGACYGSSFFVGNPTTYVARIPATFMDPANREVRDIAFAPCSAGSITANEYKMAMGHLPNPLPGAFQYPMVAGGVVVSLGSFLDLVVVHDSDLMGPFHWAYPPDVWSSMGYAAQNGTGFVWDSVHDVGLYAAHNGASIAGSFGMRRTLTEPVAIMTIWYPAMYTTTNSLGLGPKIRLEVASAPPPLASLTLVGTGCIGSSGMPMMLSSLQSPFIGNFLFSLDLSQGPAGSWAYLFLSASIASNALPVSGGCNIYLDVASMQSLIAQGVPPMGPLSTGPNGATSWSLPVPADPGISGFRLAFQAAAVDPIAPFGLVLSNAADCVIF